MSIVDEVVIDGNVVTEKAVSFVGELVTRLVYKVIAVTFDRCVYELRNRRYRI